MFKSCYTFTDLDGPILDGKYKHYNCYKDIILKGRGTPMPIDKYWDSKRNKISRKEILKISRYEDSYENFLSQWTSNIESTEYLIYDTLKPGIVEALNELKEITQKIILITRRHNRDNLIRQLNRMSIFNCFNEIINCPFENSITKYDLLKHFKYKNAIFIGDTEDDMESAKMLGIKSIAITNGLRDKRYLSADFYFHELKDGISEIMRIFDNQPK